MSRASGATPRNHTHQTQAKEPARTHQRDEITVEELRNYLNSLRSGDREEALPRRPPPQDAMGRTSSDAVTLSPHRAIVPQVLSKHTGRPLLQEERMPERTWDIHGRERAPPVAELPFVHHSHQGTPRGTNLRQARILSTLDIASPR